MTIDRDGSRRRVMASYTGNAAYETPTWSPDGDQLAFVVADAPDTDGSRTNVPYLASVREPGGRVRQLSRAQPFAPDWSPNGREILFTFHGTIRVLNVRTQRTRFVHDGGDAEWSPSGRQIVFAGKDGQIHKMNADGSTVVRLTR